MSERRKDEISAEQLDDMDRTELVRLGTELDDVELVSHEERWPVHGTRAERRAQRRVLAWFLLSALFGLAFVAVFLWWPWDYRAPDEPGYSWRVLYTPLVGLTFGLTALCLTFGIISYAKKFLPHELAVQQRHSGSSSEVDRATVAAEFADAGERSGLRRRGFLGKALGLGGGVFGLGIGVLAIGPLVRDPWKTTDGPDSLWHTGWQHKPDETVRLRVDTGEPAEIVLLRPEDMDAGGLVTVFPVRESERDDPERLAAAVRRADSAVLVFRLRPGTPVTRRAGQEDFNYGDFYAYSKVCTHLGCPVSLYEQRDNRLLCPCHQSQFSLTDNARPIFGPATRPLPQLPLDVDEEGYFVARGDFVEAVGPGFWELGS
jgi:ubiquinol-cytochrome c reductase iron-sulfur subunit